ncbi:MAG: hypothetical protein OEZ51_15000 [Nitrospinota bacterium]|nr:hypothetical protein [Nitrospinota bacterium]
MARPVHAIRASKNNIAATQSSENGTVPNDFMKKSCSTLSLGSLSHAVRAGEDLAKFALSFTSKKQTQKDVEPW